MILIIIIQIYRNRFKVRLEKVTIVLIPPFWQMQPCYSHVVAICVESLLLLLKTPEPSSRSPGKSISAGCKQLLAADGLESLKENLALQRVSDRATELITCARRIGTDSYYKSA